MKVEFHNPMFEDGKEFDVGGLLLINGEETEITDEDLELYEARNGRPLYVALQGSDFAKVDNRTVSNADKEKAELAVAEAEAVEGVNDDKEDDTTEKEGDD